MCGCLSHAPYWGPGLQPWPVPLMGIELAIFRFSGRTPSTEPLQPGRELGLRLSAAMDGSGGQGSICPQLWSSAHCYLVQCL